MIQVEDPRQPSNPGLLFISALACTTEEKGVQPQFDCIYHATSPDQFKLSQTPRKRKRQRSRVRKLQQARLLEEDGEAANSGGITQSGEEVSEDSVPPLNCATVSGNASSSGNAPSPCPALASGISPFPANVPSLSSENVPSPGNGYALGNSASVGQKTAIGDDGNNPSSLNQPIKKVIITERKSVANSVLQLKSCTTQQLNAPQEGKPSPKKTVKEPIPFIAEPKSEDNRSEEPTIGEDVQDKSKLSNSPSSPKAAAPRAMAMSNLSETPKRQPQRNKGQLSLPNPTVDDDDPPSEHTNSENDSSPMNQSLSDDVEDRSTLLKPSVVPLGTPSTMTTSIGNPALHSSSVNHVEIAPLRLPVQKPAQSIFWLIFWDIENINKPHYMPVWQFIRCIRSFISRVRHQASTVSPPTVVDSVSNITVVTNIMQMSGSIRAELHASGVQLMHVQSSTRKDVADKALLTDLCMIPLHHAPPIGVALLSGDVDFSYAMAKLTALGYPTLVIAREQSYSPLLASSSTYVASVSDVIATKNDVCLNGGHLATTVQSKMADIKKQMEKCRKRAQQQRKNEKLKREGNPSADGGHTISTGSSRGSQVVANDPGLDGGGVWRSSRGRGRGSFRGGRSRRGGGRGGHHLPFAPHGHDNGNGVAAGLRHDAVNIAQNEVNSVDISASAEPLKESSVEELAIDDPSMGTMTRSKYRWLFFLFAIFVVLFSVFLMLKQQYDKFMRCPGMILCD